MFFFGGGGLACGYTSCPKFKRDLDFRYQHSIKSDELESNHQLVFDDQIQTYQEAEDDHQIRSQDESVSFDFDLNEF